MLYFLTVDIWLIDARVPMAGAGRLVSLITKRLAGYIDKTDQDIAIETAAFRADLMRFNRGTE